MNSSCSYTHMGPALLILSAPCWWVGAFAFLSVVGPVYSVTDSASQIMVVPSHPTAWLAQNLCFLSGLLAAAGGLVTLTNNTRLSKLRSIQSFKLDVAPGTEAAQPNQAALQPAPDLGQGHTNLFF